MPGNSNVFNLNQPKLIRAFKSLVPCFDTFHTQLRVYACFPEITLTLMANEH